MQLEQEKVNKNTHLIKFCRDAKEPVAFLFGLPGWGECLHEPTAFQVPPCPAGAMG